MAPAASVDGVARVRGGAAVPARRDGGADLVLRPGRLVDAAVAAVERVRRAPARAVRGVGAQRADRRGAQRVGIAAVAVRGTRQVAGAAAVTGAAGSPLGHGDVVARYRGGVDVVGAAGDPLPAGSRRAGTAGCAGEDAGPEEVALVRVEPRLRGDDGDL